MEGEDTVITCAVNIDCLNTQGISVHKISHKTTTLRPTELNRQIKNFFSCGKI